MISENISTSVLTIGEEYKTPKGGISGVINSYSGYFPSFKFIATYKPNYNKYFNFFYFWVGVFLVFCKLILDKKIKIIHIHGAHYGSFFRKLVILFITKKIFSKKIIYHSHGSDFHIFYNGSNRLVKKSIHYFFLNTDLVICLSKQWEMFFKDTFILKEIIVLENIVEPAKTTAENKNANTVNILFLGLIGDRKGLFDLLEIVKENKDYFHGKVIFTIGGNGEVKRLEKFININDLQSLVQYVGWVSGERKSELLSLSDMFVLPSYNEGLPVSILEAMTYKLPVISTNVGGIPEVIHHKVNGLLFNAGDRAALLENLKILIENPELMNQMGSKSEIIILPYYAESVIPKLESIYKNML